MPHKDSLPSPPPMIERLDHLLFALRKGIITFKKIAASSDLYEEVTVRTFRRDINALRYLGFVIKCPNRGCYELVSEPVQLELSKEEARLFAALRAVFPAGHPYHPLIESFLERLRPFLTSQIATLLDEPVPMQMSLATATDYEPYRITLRKIQNALHRQVRIGFDYEAQDQVRAYKVVHPIELRFKNGHFYLNAYVAEIRRALEFRIDRILSDTLRIFAAPSQPRPPRLIRFSYRLSARIAKRGVSERFENQEVEPQEDGSAIVYAEGTSRFRIIQELLHYGEQAELLEPDWLREKMGETVQAMAKLYRDEI